MQERHVYIEQRCVTRGLDVVADNERQEIEVVGDSRSDAAALRRVPPVLHVSLFELSGGRSHDLSARFVSGAVHKRHRVLQLVAEAESAARLVEPSAAPYPATKCLIDQPAIEHQIQRGVWRVDLYGAEDAFPSRRDGV